MHGRIGRRIERARKARLHASATRVMCARCAAFTPLSCASACARSWCVCASWLSGLLRSDRGSLDGDVCRLLPLRLPVRRLRELLERVDHLAAASMPPRVPPASKMLRLLQVPPAGPRVEGGARGVGARQRRRLCLGTVALPLAHPTRARTPTVTLEPLTGTRSNQHRATTSAQCSLVPKTRQALTGVRMSS